MQDIPIQSMIISALVTVENKTYRSNGWLDITVFKPEQLQSLTFYLSELGSSSSKSCTSPGCENSAYETPLI